MKEAVLSGKKLTKYFGNNTVLYGIDEEIFAGDFTVIMGSSGSGKSTLPYAFSGMDRLSGGQLSFCFKDMAAANITATPVGYFADTEELAKEVQGAYGANLGDTRGVDVYFWITKTID